MVQEKKNRKVDYKIMSTKKCSICKRPLKANVINRNENINLCYVCFKLSKGKQFMNEKGKKISLIDLHVDNCKKYGGTIKFINGVKNY